MFELGVKYPRPTIRTKSYGELPLLTPAHEDTELMGVKQEHYHVDLRFLPSETLTYWAFEKYQSLDIADCLKVGIPTSICEGSMYPRQWEYLREMPQYPYEDGMAYWMAKLQDRYSACKLGPDRVCPHQSTALLGISAVNDIITCPAHGLQWSESTGEMVKRPMPVEVKR